VWVVRRPCGERFLGIAGRLRSFLAGVDREAAGRRVLIVAHGSVVALLRHVLEHDDGTDVRDIAGYGEVRNTAISTWERRDGRLHLVEFNAVPHL